MTRKDYTQEFKEQILRECQEVGNVAVVARRHNISPNTIHTWKRKAKKTGSTTPLPTDDLKRIRELEARLEKIGTENDRLKRIVAEKELQITIMEEMRDLKNPPVTDKVMIASRWIEQGYNAGLVLHSVGLASSTYYSHKGRQSKKTLLEPDDKQEPLKGRAGRQILGYSYTYTGQKISDEQIKEFIMEEISGDGYPYGYKKLTTSMQEDYGLNINHKKVYRLCKELDVLLPQRKVNPKHPRKLAKRTEVTDSNQLWEMDLKYGYIAGIDRFFFVISIIDVYDRCIVGYHIGLNALALDALKTLRQAILLRGVTDFDKLILRTDNGPQFTAHAFQDGCVELPVNHTRIPNNTPNMNAHIESFHSILESDCLSRHEFQSYAEAYKCVSEFMDYYNNRRRHGSLKNKAPMVFYRSNIDRELRPAMMVA
ncbi:MAG: IS3 family transposase [Limnochordia bacterium]